MALEMWVKRRKSCRATSSSPWSLCVPTDRGIVTLIHHASNKREVTHPLHATLDDGMSDANELGKLCLKDHDAVVGLGGEEESGRRRRDDEKGKRWREVRFIEEFRDFRMCANGSQGRFIDHLPTGGD